MHVWAYVHAYPHKAVIINHKMSTVLLPINNVYACIYVRICDQVMENRWYSTFCILRSTNLKY